MATFRGHPVGVDSSSSLDRLRRTMADLVSGEASDSDAGLWGEFLDQAGGSELAQVGSSWARKSPAKRGELIRRLAEFAENPDWNLRDSIARLFGAIGDPRAAPHLRQLLLDREEPLVRYSALKSLAELGFLPDPDEIAGLLDDRSPLVREEARKSIAGASDSAHARATRDDRAEVISRLLKQVSDPTRLQIVLLLDDAERNVGDLATELGQTQPAVSHHLALLRHGGLIAPRRHGKFNHYHLTEMGRKLVSSVNLLISPPIAGDPNRSRTERNPIVRS